MSRKRVSLLHPDGTPKTVDEILAHAREIREGRGAPSPYSTVGELLNDHTYMTRNLTCSCDRRIHYLSDYEWRDHIDEQVQKFFDIYPKLHVIQED